MVKGFSVLMEMLANGASRMDEHGAWKRRRAGVSGGGSHAFSEIDSHDRLLVSCVIFEPDGYMTAANACVLRIVIEDWGCLFL